LDILQVVGATCTSTPYHKLYDGGHGYGEVHATNADGHVVQLQIRRERGREGERKGGAQRQQPVLTGIVVNNFKFQRGRERGREREREGETKKRHSFVCAGYCVMYVLHLIVY
jgi:hypothetical protein